MKNILLTLLLSFSIAGYAQQITQAADSQDRNNNFYDNEPLYKLKTNNIEIVGEIENPGKVDFTKLNKRSVIVKETKLNADGTDSFIGAYRYDGYSLFDILNERIINKKNADKFRPIIDLYVEVENNQGDKVVISWGEIYYPNNLHNIIIATDVMRIIPSKTKELWPLPVDAKLIVTSDLLTERNISNPVKITVKSFDKDIPVNQNITPLYSESFNFIDNDKQNEFDRDRVVKELDTRTLHTIFYGRGKGIHSTSAFTGFLLKEVILPYTKLDSQNLRGSMIVINAKDGYRTVYTYSEIMNRNDQSEILLVPAFEEKEGGAWKIFPSCDFFSDRAVKAITDIYYIH